MTAAEPSTLYCRDESVTDLLVREGESLLLSHHQLLRLSPLGTTLMLACEQPQSFTALVQAVIDDHGEPPTGDADALVEVALTSLVEAGVVAR